MRLFAAVPKLAVAVTLLIAMTACSVSTTVIFANASKHSVSISFKDDRHMIVSLIIAPNSTVEIKHLLDASFSIVTPESTMEYERTPAPVTYIEQIGFGPFLKRVVKAQLENDGCIYLLSKEDAIPNQQHEAQPPDFPLCPQVSTLPRKTGNERA